MKKVSVRTTPEGDYLEVMLRDTEVEIIAQRVVQLLRDQDTSPEWWKRSMARQSVTISHDGTHPDCIVCHPVSA